MDLVVLQFCYDHWWEMLTDDRIEYVNANNATFFLFEKIVRLISFL